MVDLTLEAFRATGLPLDWQSVWVAYTVPSYFEQSDFISKYHSFAFLVSQDEIQSIAVDALLFCEPDDEDALFRIADDDTVSRTDINRHVAAFAAKSRLCETDAMRKWRVVFVQELLAQRPKTALRLGYSDYAYVTEPWDYSWEIDTALRQWKISPKPPEVGTDDENTFVLNLAALDAWLAREKAELMQIPAPTVAGLPPPAQ